MRACRCCRVNVQSGCPTTRCCQGGLLLPPDSWLLWRHLLWTKTPMSTLDDADLSLLVIGSSFLPAPPWLVPHQATGRQAVVQVQDARAADVTGTFACIDEAAAGLGWTPEVRGSAKHQLCGNVEGYQSQNMCLYTSSDPG